MRLLVFAHVPPPHHGQAYMVQLMLEGLQEAEKAGKLEVFHVDARFSEDIGDVGGIRAGKFFRLFQYCLFAIWLRLRHRIDTWYYVPAPAKRSAVLRDWVVMALVRPWFKKTIFHWHAFGLGHWAAHREEHPTNEEKLSLPPPVLFGRWDSLAQAITRRLMRGADLSIVLTEYNRRDAELLHPRKIAVVPNGIKDPIADTAEAIMEERLARQAQRLEALQEWQAGRAPNPVRFQTLFLAHCSREKGLFRAADLVLQTNHTLRKKGYPIQVDLIAAGEFVDEKTRQEYTRLCHTHPETLHHAGFVSGQQKFQLLAESDCLLFPTEYSGETFGLVLLEASLFGLPVLTSRWRRLIELTATPIQSEWSEENLLRLIEGKTLFQQARQHARAGYSEALFKNTLLEQITALA